MHQLTIFYGGKVVVVDNFPSTKVKDLLQMANGAGDGAGDKAGSSSFVQQSPPQPAHNTLPGTNSHALFCSSTMTIYNTCRQRDCFSSEFHVNFHMKSLPLTEFRHFCWVADLPIARRNSLHRFLEKRKGRYPIELVFSKFFLKEDSENAFRNCYIYDPNILCSFTPG